MNIAAPGFVTTIPTEYRITVRAAAEILRVSSQRVRFLIATKQIPAERWINGRNWVLDRRDVNYLRSTKRKAGRPRLPGVPNGGRATTRPR